VWDGYLEGQKNPDRLKRSILVDRIGVHSTFLPRTILDTQLTLWAATAVVHRTILHTHLTLWTTTAVVHRTILHTQLTLWAASAVVHHTILDTQLTRYSAERAADTEVDTGAMLLHTKI